jgi:signal transduction histidine kinase
MGSSRNILLLFVIEVHSRHSWSQLMRIINKHQEEMYRLIRIIQSLLYLSNPKRAQQQILVDYPTGD